MAAAPAETALTVQGAQGRVRVSKRPRDDLVATERRRFGTWSPNRRMPNRRSSSGGASTHAGDQDVIIETPPAHPIALISAARTVPSLPSSTEVDSSSDAVLCLCGEPAELHRSRWFCRRGPELGGCRFDQCVPPVPRTPLCGCGRRSAWEPLTGRFLCDTPLSAPFSAPFSAGSCYFAMPLLELQQVTPPPGPEDNSTPSTPGVAQVATGSFAGELTPQCCLRIHPGRVCAEM